MANSPDSRQLIGASGEATASARSSSLDVAGMRHGTHLSSLGKGCLAAWQPLLEPLRNVAFDLLEIGVGSGASLRTWRERYPHARLAGLDARRIALDPPVERCHLVQGSQTDLTAFHLLLRGHEFRLVIDDGSRLAEDQVATFLALFPWLPPGAFYICAGLEEGVTGRQGEVANLGAHAWFAGLGAALSDREQRQRHPWNSAAVATVMERCAGVLLTRGSAVVLR
jgi:hypothetical protein